MRRARIRPSMLIALHAWCALSGCAPASAPARDDSLDAPLPTPTDVCESLGSTQIDHTAPGLVIDVEDAPRLALAVRCFPKTRTLRLILSGLDDLAPLARLPHLEWLTLDPHESPSACGAMQSLPTLRQVRHVVVQVACISVDFERLLRRLPELESFRLVDRRGELVLFARPGSIVPGNAGSEALRERARAAARARFPEAEASAP